MAPGNKPSNKTKAPTPKGKPTIRFKVGNTVKAKSGRIYVVEKLRSDGKLQGREQNPRKPDTPFGPTRVFAPGNVTPIALPTSEASAKPSTKKTPVPRKPVQKKASSSKQSNARKKDSGGGGGCLEAAAVVLGKSKEPLSCPTIMEQVLKQKLWSTAGKTPHQTLSSAIQREITKKKKESRFVKTGRGLYAINPKSLKATSDGSKR